MCQENQTCVISPNMAITMDFTAYKRIEKVKKVQRTVPSVWLESGVEVHTRVVESINLQRRFRCNMYPRDLTFIADRYTGPCRYSKTNGTPTFTLNVAYWYSNIILWKNLFNYSKRFSKETKGFTRFEKKYIFYSS